MNKAFVREPDVEVPEQLPELPLPPPPNPVTAEGNRRIVAALEAAATPRERRYWAARLSTARITPPPADADEIGFGSQVTLDWPGRGAVTLSIVGEDEADPAKGLIGWRAPVAAALTGNGTGDEVAVTLAGRQVVLRVRAVRNLRSEP